MSCRAICDEVLHKLPREMRDLIYESILNVPRHSSVLFKAIPKSNDHRRLRHSDVHQALVLSGLALRYDKSHMHKYHEHCFDQRFVGTIFLRELVETWYRKATFRFASIDVLKTFIYHSTTSIQVRSETFVTKVVISADAVDFLAKGHCGDCSQCGYYSHCKGADRCLTTLNLLSNIQHRVSVDVKMCNFFDILREDFDSDSDSDSDGTAPSQRLQFPENIAYFTELAKTLQSLKKCGHTVRVSSRSSDYLSKFPILSDPQSFPKGWLEWIKACRRVSSDT